MSLKKLLLLSDHKLPSQQLTLLPKKLQISNQLNIAELNLEDLQQYQSEWLLFAPNALAKLIQASAEVMTQNFPSYLWVKTHSGQQKLPLAEVDYFSAEDKYVIAYAGEQEILIDDTLNHLVEQFEEELIRIHRKTVVNIHKIEAVVRNKNGQHEVKLQTQSKIFAVSRRQVANLKRKLKGLAKHEN